MAKTDLAPVPNPAQDSLANLRSKWEDMSGSHVDFIGMRQDHALCTKQVIDWMSTCQKFSPGNLSNQ